MSDLRKACLLLWCAILAILAGVRASSGGDTVERKAPPSGVELERASKVFEEVFGEAKARAKTNTDRLALARQVLGTAEGNQGEAAAENYVRLQAAKDLAVQGGDFFLAFQIVDRMEEGFTIDALEMRDQILARLAKANLSTEQRNAAVRALLHALDRAAAYEQFELAERISRKATDLSQRLADVELRKSVRERTGRVTKITEMAHDANKSRDRLKSEPDNAEAHLAVGTYSCLVRGDWEKGLPHLAAGSDQALQKAAQLDHSAAASVEGQVAAGDAWWDLAGKAGKVERENLQQRAAYWYEQAMPKLSGLSKERISRHLSEIRSLDVASQARVAGKAGEGAGRPSSASRLPTVARGKPAPAESRAPESFFATPEQVQRDPRIGELEEGLRQAPGKFSWEVHNQLRHRYWRSDDLRKSLYHSNLILKHSFRDGYIVDVCFGGKNSDNLAALRNLAKNAVMFPDFPYVSAACCLKAGDLEMAGSDASPTRAKQWYKQVLAIECKDAEFERYRAAAQEKLTLSGK